MIEYLKTPPNRDGGAPSLLERAGRHVSVTSWREKGHALPAELGLSRHGPDGTTSLLDAISEHPILLNRPLVVTPEGRRSVPPLRRVVLDLLPAQQGEFVKEDGERVVDEHGRRVATA